VKGVSLAPMRESRRHRKLPVDPRRANGWLWEEERQADGTRAPVLAVFLAGAECPFRCVFCDLWQRTLDGPTPAGAIPAQLRAVLDESGPVPGGATIKLYNASNFFDPRAVPPDDDAAITELAAPFARVVVESHPRLIGARCEAFARRLDGRLEVAAGLETAHPEALARLDKDMTLADVERAAGVLRATGAALRVFLLAPPPFVPPGEAEDSVVHSVAYARALGAAHVSLIPTRSQAADALRLDASLTPPDLDLIERVLDRCLEPIDTVVAVDLWDIERLARCEACRDARIARLRAINLTGRPAPRILCAQCGSPS